MHGHHESLFCSMYPNLGSFYDRVRGVYSPDPEQKTVLPVEYLPCCCTFARHLPAYFFSVGP